MPQYPKVNRKLPDLFTEVINHDAYRSACLAQRVVDWDEYRKGLKRKRELVKAGDEYIKQCKKD